MSIRATLRRNAGFSMIEVMVASALVAISVLGLAFQMAAQKNAKGSADTENIGRRVMARLADVVMAQITHFPFFQNAGKGIVYVGCFDVNGGPVPTDPAASIPNVKDYIGVWTIDPTNVTQFAAALTGANLVCTQNNAGGYEVHVAPSPSDPLGPKVGIAVIPLSVTGSTIQASTSPAFSISVRLAGLTAIPATPFGGGVLTGQWCPPTPATYLCSTAAAACGKTVCSDQFLPGGLYTANNYCFCY